MNRLCLWVNLGNFGQCRNSRGAGVRAIALAKPNVKTVPTLADILIFSIRLVFSRMLFFALFGTFSYFI